MSDESLNQQPFVSILTPVYNGEPYLAECIESVLTQTFSNFEYIIVNNCSKDATGQIAKQYAQRDRRIRVVDSDTFRGVIGNHNYAFSLINPQSKYVKVVSADDVVFPDCLTQLIRVAETHQSVGIVSSYQLSGGGDDWVVRCTGLPYWQTVVSGKEICRSHLLTAQNLFGAPTSVLYRADLVRSTPEFYPNPRAEADVSCCVETLLRSDFGFVHQVLSYERCHGPRVSTTSRSLNAYVTSRLNDLKVYGPPCLSAAEMNHRRNELLKDFYRGLAIAIVNLRDRDYWRYQKERLKELDMQLDWLRLSGAVCAKLVSLLTSPVETWKKISRRFKRNTAQQQAALLSKASGA